MWLICCVCVCVCVHLCLYRSRLQEAESAESVAAGVGGQPVSQAAAVQFSLRPAGGVPGCCGRSAGQGALQPGQTGGCAGRPARPPPAAQPGLLHRAVHIQIYICIVGSANTMFFSKHIPILHFQVIFFLRFRFTYIFHDILREIFLFLFDSLRFCLI